MTRTADENRRPEHSQNGPMAVEIANGLGHVLANALGRGPTRTRAYVHDDVVVYVMRDYMNKAERMLVAAGEQQGVLEHRRAIQSALAGELIDVVESVTGRSVEGFFSDNSTSPDAAVEVFLLAPDDRSAY